MSRNLEAHPLFPAKSDDDDPPEIVSIKVSRREATGGMVFVPDTFPADSLTDEVQIFERWGGGVYEIIGRDTQRITARRGVVLAGPSKPLYSGGPLPGDNGTPPVVTSTPQALPQSNGTPAWIAMVTAVMPLILQWLSGQQQMAQQNMQANQAMLQAMMSQSQNSNTQMMTLLASVNKPSGGAGGEDFRSGMSFMQEILAGQLEAANAKREEVGEDEGIMKTIAQITQAMEMVKGFSDMGAGSPPMNNPPAPSAAAVA